MIDSHTMPPLFPFIRMDHPCYSPLQHFRDLLFSDPRYEETRQAIDRHGHWEIRTLIRGHFLPGRRWALKGFYISFQLWGEAFRAITFFYSAKKGRLECFEFPHDPYLTTISRYWAEGRNRNISVLRYIPRLRLTFTLEEKKSSMIGKFLPGSGLKDAFVKQLAVHRAIRSPSSFKVACPIEIDEGRGLFFQEKRPGLELTTMLNSENFKDLLHKIGKIHRELHSLSVPVTSSWNVDQFLEGLKMDIQWISFFLPESGPFLDDLHALLLNQPPCFYPKGYTFCHGDFRSTQILKEKEVWSIVDFDNSRIGDPYSEIALLIAFLKYDSPFFKDRFIHLKQGEPDPLEEAEEAYLKGYQEDQIVAFHYKKYLWYRIVHEIHYLVRMLRRDLFHPIAFERTLRLLHRLHEEYKNMRGGST